MLLSCCSHVWLLVTSWTVVHQASLSMGFSRQEYWSGLPCPRPGDPPDPGITLHLLCLLHWQVSCLPLEPPGMWPWVHKISHRYSDPISVFNIFLLFLLLLPCSKQILPCFWAFVFYLLFLVLLSLSVLKKMSLGFYFHFWLSISIRLPLLVILDIKPCQTQTKPSGLGSDTQTGPTSAPKKEESINCRTLGSFQR